MLAGVVDFDRPLSPALSPHARRGRLAQRAGEGCTERRLVFAQRPAGVRARVCGHFRGRAGAHDCAARVAALGPEVDDPVGGADHVEIVLDDDERMPRGDELPERAQELRDVVEMKPGGRFVEEKKFALCIVIPAQAGIQGLSTSLGPRIRGGNCGSFDQMPRELQPLRLAARERGNGLAEPQVLEPDAGERLERPLHLGVAEKSDRLGHGQLEGVGDRFLSDFHFEDFIAKAPAVAVGTAQVHVGEELHLHVLEAVAAAARAAAVARIEAERARGVFALPGERRLRVDVADRVPGTDVARRIGARGAADRRLVDHHRVFQELIAFQLAEIPRRLRGLAFRLQQRGVEDVLHERRLSRARNAGDAHELPERNADVDVPQVVLGGAQELQGSPHPLAALGPSPARGRG